MSVELELDDLYRDIILDHYRQPRNRGTLPQPNLSGEGYNPVCGDEVSIQVTFRDGKVERVMFTGRGCSISQASSSMLTEVVRGKTIEQVSHLIGKFKGMMTQQEPPAPELGDLEALEGVSKFPVRVKCATLAWNVLEGILKERPETST